MTTNRGRPSQDVELLIAMILAEMLDGSGDQGGGPRPASDERWGEKSAAPATARTSGKPPAG